MSKPNYGTILIARYPLTEWIWDGDEYDGITWLSESPMPSKAELDALWPEVWAEIEAERKAKETARETALGKLAALGLTEAEIQALVG